MQIQVRDLSSTAKRLITNVSGPDSGSLSIDSVRGFDSNYNRLDKSGRLEKSQRIWNEVFSGSFDLSNLKPGTQAARIKPTKAIILASNFGLDVTVSVDNAGNVTSIMAEAGGTPFNIATGLINRDSEPMVFAPRESGEMADVLNKLLELNGIKTNKFVSVQRGSHLHLCIRSEEEQFWLCPWRGNLSESEIDKINQSMFAQFESIRGGILSASIAPHAGAKKGFHRNIVDNATPYDIEAIYDTKAPDIKTNPDITVDSLNAGFSMIRPNLKEFVLILSAVGIIDKGRVDDVVKRLKKQIASGNLDELAQLNRELMKKDGLNFGNLLITCSEYGLCLANRETKELVFIKNPQGIIARNETGCGDSVTAAVIDTALKNKISLRNHTRDQSVLIANEGILAGCATVEKDGSGIGTIDEIRTLQTRIGELPEPIFRKMF